MFPRMKADACMRLLFLPVKAKLERNVVALRGRFRG